MRRPGRRIEIWEINTQTGERRQKGSKYAAPWDQVEEAEIKLVTGGYGGGSVFALHFAGALYSFKTLDEARVMVATAAKEYVESCSGPWEEFIVLDTFGGDAQAFGIHYRRVALSGKRVRFMKHGKWAPPEPLDRHERCLLRRLPFSQDLWARLQRATALSRWWYEQLHGCPPPYDGWSLHRDYEFDLDLVLDFLQDVGSAVNGLRNERCTMRLRKPWQHPEFVERLPSDEAGRLETPFVLLRGEE